MSTQTALRLAGGLLTVSPTPASMPLDSLCGFASRQNPKRAFLFVSKVLGKHIPVEPARMKASHEQLATALLAALPAQGDVLFLGFAETATGLGAGVFEACLRQAPRRFADEQGVFIQTTRYHFDRPIALDFREEHSHATGHLVYEPSVGQRCFKSAPTVVLIDDELSTGKTSANFMQAFLAVNPSVKQVIMVSLLNWMSPEKKEAVAAALPGIDVSYIAALEGTFSFEADPAFVCPPMPKADGTGELKDALVPFSYGRFGETAPLRLNPTALCRMNLDPCRPVHILADGEFMHPPYVVARFLESHGFSVRVQSTTRSPILVGLAIEEKTTFADHYNDGIDNYIYNLPANAQLVLVHETVTAPSLKAAIPNLKTVYFGDLL